MAAKLLISEGHKVVLHARNAERARYALSEVSGAEGVLTGDLSNMYETSRLADEANQTGAFDAVIHNAGVYRESGKVILAVNTLAPYILTCLMRRPKRLVYLSSGMHSGGDVDLKNLSMERGVSYSDSKLHDVILAMAVARKWPDVYANAVNPGWVPTKMGGGGAPDDLDKGAGTQAWLTVSNEEGAKVSGRYFFHKREGRCRPEASDPNVQDEFLAQCQRITGVKFPE